jgi:DNA-binding CsgD family transcriptional regulator/tetratricopeptide (TPR) repeat protein
MAGSSLSGTRRFRVPITGRDEELRVLTDFLSVIHDGMSAALLLTGEPGIGKTRLLDQLAATSPELRVVRTAGVESEARLAFAALHRLLRAFPEGMESLPEPQREALASALGMVAGPPPDRYLISLATLTLLAGAAARQPLLCLVDDLQWLDRESADVLTFVGRRLGADSVGLVLAGRGDSSEAADGGLPSAGPESEPAAKPGTGAFEGFTVVALRGLPATDADRLLRGNVPGRLDPEVAARVIAESGGNPLALLEIADALSPAHLAGAVPLHEPLPVGARLENHYQGLIRALPAPTRTFLVLLAAAPPEDPMLLWRAAGELGVSAGAADAAMSAGVITHHAPHPAHGRLIGFRHPLIRSAVYRGADPAERRRVHRALAAVTDPVRTPERRAWHRAESVIGLDEEVADELDQAAQRARSRGGYAAQAELIARAAELSVAGRARRLVEAARAHLVLGDAIAAGDLLERAEPLLTTDDAVLRAHVLHSRATIDLYSDRISDVPALLTRAADAVAEPEPALARAMFVEALVAAFYDNHGILREFSSTVLASPALRSAPWTGADLLLRGFALRLTAGYAQALPVLQAGFAALCQDGADVGLGTPVSPLTVYAADEIWDEVAGLRAAEAIDAEERRTGALGALRQTLLARASWKLRMGRMREAAAHLDEAEDIGVVTGWSAAGPAFRIELLAWSGQEAETRAMAEATARNSMAWAVAGGQGDKNTQGGLEGYGDWARYCMTILELSLGHYAEAARYARTTFAKDNPGATARILPDLIEASMRSGDDQTAKEALRWLEERATPAGTPWALGILARCRALMTDDEQAEVWFAESVEHLSQTRLRIEVARTHLLYGEWLRRKKRRADARVELRTAHGMFADMGAAGFAERARLELLATGEHAGRRAAADGGRELTPQERRIAELAGGGATNTEIATRLFITQSTVEYHLNKVFRKLDITSRRQLRAVFGGGG